MANGPGKSDQAFRTISELATELGIPQHILRYWETRFPQLKPLQRAGNRRYYRPADVDLARRIHRLLNQDGYTIRGVQQLLAGPDRAGPLEDERPPARPSTLETPSEPADALSIERLRQIRGLLADALSQ